MKAAYVLCAALALAACDSDDDEVVVATPPTEPAPPPTEPTEPVVRQTIQIGLIDFALQPNSVTLPGPGTYVFRATNNGGTLHSLQIDGQGISARLASDLTVGQSGEMTVTLGSGPYEMFCPVLDHRQLGMTGTILVGVE